MNISELDNLIEKLGEENPPIQKGVTSEFVKTSITLQTSHLEKLQDLAWLKKTTIKNILCQIISTSLESIENSSFAKASIAPLDSGWTKSSLTLPSKDLDKLRVVAAIKKSTIRDVLYLFLEKQLSKIEIRSSLKIDINHQIP